MTKSSIIKVFPATRCLPMLILRLCLMVWTNDLIASAESTQITHRICKNAVNSSVESMCCQPIVEFDIHLDACFHYLNTSISEEKFAHAIQLSKFTECLYTKRNYMKSDTKLNIGRVKAEANRLYKNDTLMKDYMINAYRDCARIATKKLELLKKYEEAKDLLTQSHKPYFMFHYNCVLLYSTYKCPYFIWEGKTDNDDDICTEFSAMCQDD